MSYTPVEIADGVWTHPTRTVDGSAPAASDGTVLDNIAYAIWTYSTRTVSGGPPVFPTTISETLQSPSQYATVQTVMPVTVSELTLTPEQAAIAGTSINVIVDESTLAPSQSILAETSGGGKKKSSGAWSYYPPIYAIRTKGSQEAPAPGERVRAKFKQAPKQIVIMPEKPVYFTMARQSTPAPIQAGNVKSHREVKAMRREEQDILTLLASL